LIRNISWNRTGEVFAGPFSETGVTAGFIINLPSKELSILCTAAFNIQAEASQVGRWRRVSEAFIAGGKERWTFSIEPGVVFPVISAVFSTIFLSKNVI
jgi:hypothetical protein